MPVKMGPLNDDHESGVSWWLSGKMLSVGTEIFETLTNGKAISVTFSANKNRLSLHGESEHAGDGFRAGVIACLYTLFTPLLGLLGAILLGDFASLLSGTILHLPSLLLLLAYAFVFLFSMRGIGARLTTLEVFDHTTEKVENEAVEQLKESYANNEINQDELDERLDHELEKRNNASGGA